MKKLDKVAFKNEFRKVTVSGFADVTYKTIGGDIVETKATLDPKLMGADSYGLARIPNDDDTVTYFDCDADGWRKFKTANIISVNGEKYKVR